MVGRQEGGLAGWWECYPFLSCEKQVGGDKLGQIRC